MLTLPAELMPLIIEFAPLFSKPVWEHAKVLLVGAILATGKRTVTACLCVMGLSQEKCFVNYHRVLNRARWSLLAASQTLLRLLVTRFAPEGELVFGLDDTIERRRGMKLNNPQLKAGGLVLRTESPDTGHRPVVMTPCESYRADLAQSDAPNILAPSLRSSNQQWHRNSLVPRSVAPSSAFSAWGIPRTACSRCVP